MAPFFGKLILLLLPAVATSNVTDELVNIGRHHHHHHQRRSASFSSSTPSSLIWPKSSAFADDLALPIIRKNITNETLLLEKNGKIEQILALQLARDRCLKTTTATTTIVNHTANGKYCPSVWDDVLCWPPTPANKTAWQPCPINVKGFNRPGKAYKNCTETGKWFFHNGYGRYWTDYHECDDRKSSARIITMLDDAGDDFRWYHSIEEAVEKLSRIRHHIPWFQFISHLGYSISFVSLVIAFIILIYVKRLRCPRNSLHLQLFISFIIRSSMYLIKTTLDSQMLISLFTTNSASTVPIDTHHQNDIGLTFPDHTHQHPSLNHALESLKKTGVVVDPGSPDLLMTPTRDGWTVANSYQSSSIGCKLFTVLWQYSLLANYNWIFMEGLYLHNVIFLNIFNDNSNIRTYIILGWTLPIPIIAIWSLMRALYEDTRCWRTNTNSNIFWITRAPTTIIIVLNFVFFVNIIRVLFLKMFAKSVATQARKYKYRAWFRSTLVLVPLFGVHYMFMLAFTTVTFRSYDIFEIIWLYSDLTFTTFQGFLVALLYCFFNHEVQIELKKLWLTFKQKNFRFFWRNNNSNNQQNHRTTTSATTSSHFINQHPVLAIRLSSAIRFNDPEEQSEHKINGIDSIINHTV